MAVLYTRTNAGAVDDPEFGHFDAGPDGDFDFPDELSDRLHRFHLRRKPAWETEDERALRLHGEERDRRRDPEALYNAVADIAGMAKQFAGASPAPAPAALSPEVAAELAELRRQVAELQAQAAAGDGGEETGAEGGESGAAPGRPPASRRKAPAAKTA